MTALSIDTTDRKAPSVWTDCKPARVPMCETVFLLALDRQTAAYKRLGELADRRVELGEATYQMARTSALGAINFANRELAGAIAAREEFYRKQRDPHAGECTCRPDGDACPSCVAKNGNDIPFMEGVR